MQSRRPKPTRVSDHKNSHSKSSSSPRFKKDQEFGSKRPRINKGGEKPSYVRNSPGRQDDNPFSYLRKTNEKVGNDRKRSSGGSSERPAFKNSFGQKSKDVMDRFNKRSGGRSDAGERSSGGERKYDRPFKPRHSEGEGRERNFEKKGDATREFGDRKSAERYSKTVFGKEGSRRSSEDRGDRPSGGSFRSSRSDSANSERKPWSKDDRPFREKRSDRDFDSNKRAFGDKGKTYHAAENPIYSKKKKVQSTPSDESLGIRLNRFIANAGVCARREADKLIEAGEIYVNGKVMSDFSYRVQETDTVKYGSKILKRERHVYLLLNKPKDFLTTTDDPEERKTVMDLVKSASSARLYPVGRLDRNTTGLLVVTNDGELADKLMHPSFMTKKIYQVDLDRPFSPDDLRKLKEGITLEDGFIKADDVDIVSPDRKSVGIEIHSGRNRIVRRIFEHLEYTVVRLDRVMYAGLTKKDLPRGTWRYLSELEVKTLKHLI